MRVVVFIVILLICILVAFAFYAYVARSAERNGVVRPDPGERWKVELEDRYTMTEAWLTKGEYREWFGSTPLQDADYSDKLINLELAAEERARERNNARRVLGQ